MVPLTRVAPQVRLQVDDVLMMIMRDVLVQVVVQVLHPPNDDKVVVHRLTFEHQFLTNELHHVKMIPQLELQPKQ